jgi:ribose 5-phosphate isomerase B
LGGRTTGLAEATDAVDTFFTTAYEGGRHQKRLDEISQYESSRTDPAETTVGGTGDDHERQHPSS